MRDESGRQLDKTSPFLGKEALEATELCKDVYAVTKLLARSVR